MNERKTLMTPEEYQALVREAHATAYTGKALLLDSIVHSAEASDMLIYSVDFAKTILSQLHLLAHAAADQGNFQDKLTFTSREEIMDAVLANAPSELVTDALKTKFRNFLETYFEENGEHIALDDPRIQSHIGLDAKVNSLLAQTARQTGAKNVVH